MRTLLVSLAVLICSVHVGAQDSDRHKNRLSTSVYQLEPLVETFNDVRIGRFFNGVYYEWIISRRITGVAGLTYGEQIVDDQCRRCADNYEGTGQFKEFAVFLGSRFGLGASGRRVVKPFVQTDLYHGRSRYAGSFVGGIAGQRTSIDSRYTKYGLVGRAGIDIQLYKSLFFTPITAFKIGRVRETRFNNNTPHSSSDIGWIPLDLRVGVNF